MNLGIIGTAGRGEDGEKLKIGHWILMNSVAQSIALSLGVERLISGGAAWSDHIAVNLFLNSTFDLTLHLPTDFKDGKYKDVSGFKCGDTANYYHKLFSEKLKINSLQQIDNAISNLADVEITYGFKQRNTMIAMDSNILLAFTFGNGERLKEGGTKDTMDKFLNRIGKREEGPLAILRAFHYDLNSKQLFEIN